MKTINNQMRSLVAIVATLIITSSVAFAQSKSQYKAEIEQLKEALAQLTSVNETVASNLKKFDDLDFVYFTNQEWAKFHESHSQDIIVHWPDGHFTTGLEAHIKDLADMFVYAPDTRIEEHPIKIGDGNLTAVMGVIEGTFTKPMPIGNGQFIQPTGKAYKMNMVTIGLWNEEGVMYEEYLFWDNMSFMKQLGLQ